MNPVRNVLVPIDFSKASRTAVKYALTAQEYKNDHLVLLHSYRLINDGFSNPEDSPQLLRSSLENELLETYKKFNSTIEYSQDQPEVEFKMGVGFTVNCVKSICNESKIDLILYALKDHKKNESLTELIKLRCASIKLISENFDSSDKISLINGNVSIHEFMDDWQQYIYLIEKNPKLSFTVVPD